MIYKDAFSYYHPAVNFIYFCAVFCFTMFFINMVAIGISFLCAVIYLFLLEEKAPKFIFKFCLPLFIITAAINPLFNHQGVTVICYFKSGNPLTAESIFYGAAAGLTVITVIIWFKCLNIVLSGDKFIFLFGKITPSLALVLSMALRFIPKFIDEFKYTYQNQKVLLSNLNRPFKKVRAALISFSVMVSLSLEGAVHTSNSMKARGFGTKKRTSFTIFSFKTKDFLLLLILCLFIFYITFGGIFGGFYFAYYPNIYINLGLYEISLYIMFFLLLITPVAINAIETLKHKLCLLGE